MLDVARAAIVKRVYKYMNPDLFSEDVKIAESAALPQRIDMAQIDAKNNAKTYLLAFERSIPFLSFMLDDENYYTFLKIAESGKMQELLALQSRVKVLEDENSRLRAALSYSDQPCAYCSLPRDEWSKCASGFPGCARSDDAMGYPDLGASLVAEELRGRVKVLEKALKPFAVPRGNNVMDDTSQHDMAEFVTFYGTVEGDHVISVGCFRRARAALEGK